MLRKRNRSYTDAQFIDAVSSSYSVAEVLRKLNLCPYGATYRAFHILVRKLELDTSHFKGMAWSKAKKLPIGNRVVYSIQELLTENSPHGGGNNLKLRLLNAGILSNKCDVCGIVDWMGKPLTIQLDHINGINTDQRRENLRMLCPNCHSQTHNFAGRNQKK